MDVQPNCKTLVENTDWTIILFLSLTRRSIKILSIEGNQFIFFSFLPKKKFVAPNKIKKKCVEWKIKTIFTSIIVF